MKNDDVRNMERQRRDNALAVYQLIVENKFDAAHHALSTLMPRVDINTAFPHCVRGTKQFTIGASFAEVAIAQDNLQILQMLMSLGARLPYFFGQTIPFMERPQLRHAGDYSMNWFRKGAHRESMHFLRKCWLLVEPIARRDMKLLAMLGSDPDQFRDGLFPTLTPLLTAFESGDMSKVVRIGHVTDIVSALQNPLPNNILYRILSFAQPEHALCYLLAADLPNWRYPLLMRPWFDASRLRHEVDNVHPVNRGRLDIMARFYATSPRRFALSLLAQVSGDQVRAAHLQVEQTAFVHFVRDRLARLCVVLEPLNLAALVTLAIADHALVYAPYVQMHRKWRVITAVKHHNHHNAQQTNELQK